MKFVYVLHQSHAVVGGTVSAVNTVFENEDSAILFNNKQCNNYYEISKVYLEEEIKPKKWWEFWR